LTFVEGDYGNIDGVWYAKPPNFDYLGNLRGHTVVEHDDGTITVSPSILISNGEFEWHGFLKQGIWQKI